MARPWQGRRHDNMQSDDVIMTAEATNNNGLKVSSETPPSSRNNSFYSNGGKSASSTGLSTTMNGEKQGVSVPQSTLMSLKGPPGQEESSSSTSPRRGRRRSSVKDVKLAIMRVTSTPSLRGLDISDRYFDIAPLPISERRSLSPRGKHRYSFSHIQLAGKSPPSHFENSLYLDLDSPNGVVPYPDLMSTVLDDSDHSLMDKSGRRRRVSMPERIAEKMDGLTKNDRSEVMDPYALKYLPKILRDTYAQRQTRRSWQVSCLLFDLWMICQ